jgi:hypothetical protein
MAFFTTGLAVWPSPGTTGSRTGCSPISGTRNGSGYACQRFLAGGFYATLGTLFF